MATALLVAILIARSWTAWRGGMEGAAQATFRQETVGAMEGSQQQVAAAADALGDAGAGGSGVPSIKSVYSLVATFRKAVSSLGDEPTPLATAEEALEAEVSPATLFLQWLIETAIVAGFGALCYPQSQVTGEKTEPKLTMEKGHFDCLHDQQVCLCSCFCPTLRWADTINMSGVAGFEMPRKTTFWVLFTMLATTDLLDTVLIFVCSSTLMAFYRQKLRGSLGMPPSPWSVVALDFLFATCCPWCFIAQDARVVNQMALVGKLVVVGAPAAEAPSYSSAA